MSEDTPNPSRTPNAALEQIALKRRRGAWLLPTALGVACLWWIAGLSGTIAWLGWTTISSAGPAALIAGGTLILLPGTIMVLAAMVARQTHSDMAANELILQAAARLMSPLEHSAAEAQSFADLMAGTCSNIDKAMGQSLATLKAMAGELGDERHRIESVAYASADNARDLADRLGAERARLELLARELHSQSSALNETIPKQASLMLGSVRSTVQDISIAEALLETRLNDLNESSQVLTAKISDLDALSREAVQRNETLLFAMAQIDEKLEQSGKTIEAASRGGERAVAAAGTMGDRLIEAVKTALDTAREASAEIQQRTLEASEAAAQSLAQLKSAGERTSAALKEARIPSETDMRGEPRPAGLARPDKGQVSVPPPVRPQTVSEKANAGQGWPVDPPPLEPIFEAPPASRPTLSPSPSRPVDDDLFERSADQLAASLSEESRPSAPPQAGYDPFDDTDAIMIGPKATDQDTEAPDGIIEGDFSEADTDQPPAHSLSDIIADMERQERAPMSREDTAATMVSRLMDSGIRLTDIFRPREKKKTALASRKGAKQRRSAVNQSVGRQVDRVRKRLRNDGELMMLARDFVTHEQDDALNALENTQATQKNASARLAAFLLIDAALS